MLLLVILLRGQQMVSERLANGQQNRRPFTGLGLPVIIDFYC